MRAERVHLRGLGWFLHTHAMLIPSVVSDLHSNYKIFLMLPRCSLFASANTSSYKLLRFSKDFLINEANVQSNCRSFLKKNWKTSLENIQHNIRDTQAELQRWKWNVFGFKHSHVAVLQFQNQSNVSP